MMPTAEEVEQYADKFGDSYPRTVVYLRQFAHLLRQTTEGTDALEGSLDLMRTDKAYVAMRDLCRAYEQRLKVVEARDKDDRITAENELLALLAFLINEPVVGRAAKVEKEIVARIDAIRALHPKSDRRIRGERRVDDWLSRERQTNSVLLNEAYTERSGKDRRQGK